MIIIYYIYIIFKKGFQLTNLKIANFLDLTLDLITDKSYNNQGNIPLYINVKSNHPPTL